jgi:hypothetical protein
MTTLLEPPIVFAGGKPPQPFQPLEEAAPADAEEEEEED